MCLYFIFFEYTSNDHNGKPEKSIQSLPFANTIKHVSRHQSAHHSIFHQVLSHIPAFGNWQQSPLLVKLHVHSALRKINEYQKHKQYISH